MGRRGDQETGRVDELMENGMVRDPIHMVAVSGLIRNAAGEVLMIESPERGWEVPGGRVEEGEDLIQALKREILEESGVRAEIGALVGVYSRIRAPSMILLGFAGTYLSGELTTSEESVAVEWVGPEEVIGRISHAAIRDRVQDWLGGDGRVVYRSYSLDPYRIHEQYYLEDKG
jgi:8-oxo-dGTP diphosphatase